MSIDEIEDLLDDWRDELMETVDVQKELNTLLEKVSPGSEIDDATLWVFSGDDGSPEELRLQVHVTDLGKPIQIAPQKSPVTLHAAGTFLNEIDKAIKFTIVFEGIE